MARVLDGSSVWLLKSPKHMVAVMKGKVTVSWVLRSPVNEDEWPCSEVMAER